MVQETEHSIPETLDQTSGEIISQKAGNSNLLTRNVPFDVPISTTNHAHHWIIETPDGPKSSGCCKGCGDTKEFKNWPDEMDKFTIYDRLISSMDF